MPRPAGRMQSELVEIWHKTGKTIVFITHDITEAVLLADRIGVMTKGPESRLGAIIPVDLPRPRRRSSPGFGEMWERINALIENEEASATMTEVSPARHGTPADAMAPAPRLPLGGIKRDHLIYVASIIGLIVLWHFIATTFFKPQFFPPPLLVLSTGREMLESGELFEHISISLQRILSGFLIGSAIAAPAGLLMGSIPIVRAIFDPYVQFFRFVPSLAWLTPVVIWFGIGETSKVLIIVYTTIFIVLINTMVGVSHIAPEQAARRGLPWRHPLQGIHFRDAAGDAAVHPDRHAPCHGQFVRHRGLRRDDRGGFRPRLSDLQLAPVDGDRQDLHRHRLPRRARPHHRPLLPLSHRPLRPPIWADRIEVC